MARRSANSFVSRDLDPRLSDLSSRIQVRASRGEPDPYAVASVTRHLGVRIQNSAPEKDILPDNIIE
jgi:hypothetical protein